MFHAIRPEMLERMKQLEAIDRRDRTDGTPRMQRLRQVPPETGKFIALVLAGAPAGEVIEVGTSVGYSALWLSLACEASGRRLTTFEILPDKAAKARENFKTAGVEKLVQLIEGDARLSIPQMGPIAFCFLDAEKEIYQEIYEMVIPKLVSGGWLVADNAINHRESLQPMLDQALADPRVDAMILPLEKGELVCRRI